MLRAATSTISCKIRSGRNSLSFVQLRPFHSTAHAPPYTSSYKIVFSIIYVSSKFIEIVCAFHREFCSPLWLQLLVKLIKAGGDPVCEETSFSLTAQLQAIDLLRVLLPEWTGTVDQQKEFLIQLVDLLAEHVLLTKPDVVLEMAHSENRPSQSDGIQLFQTFLPLMCHYLIESSLRLGRGCSQGPLDELLQRNDSRCFGWPTASLVHVPQVDPADHSPAAAFQHRQPLRGVFSIYWWCYK